MQLPSTGHLADAQSPWKSLALKSGTRIVPGMTHGSSCCDLKSHQQGDNPECRDSHLSWVSGHIFSAHSFAGAAGILETKTVNWRRGPGSLKRMHVRILYTSSTRRREAQITPTVILQCQFSQRTSSFGRDVCHSTLHPPPLPALRANVNSSLFSVNLNLWRISELFAERLKADLPVAPTRHCATNSWRF